MTEPGEPIRRVMSVGAAAVDEKLTLRSVAAVLAEMETALSSSPAPTGARRSCRSVMSRAVAQGAEPGEVWVADVMTEDVVIEGVRHVAVVDNGAIVGVVSARDVLDVLVEYARVNM
jgi:CBS domain-containing protein